MKPEIYVSILNVSPPISYAEAVNWQKQLQSSKQIGNAFVLINTFYITSNQHSLTYNIFLQNMLSDRDIHQNVQLAPKLFHLSQSTFAKKPKDFLLNEIIGKLHAQSLTIHSTPCIKPKLCIKPIPYSIPRPPHSSCTKITSTTPPKIPHKIMPISQSLDNIKARMHPKTSSSASSIDTTHLKKTHSEARMHQKIPLSASVIDKTRLKKTSSKDSLPPPTLLGIMKVIYWDITGRELTLASNLHRVTSSTKLKQEPCLLVFTLTIDKSVPLPPLTTYNTFAKILYEAPLQSSTKAVIQLETGEASEKEDAVITPLPPSFSALLNTFVTLQLDSQQNRYVLKFFSSMPEETSTKSSPLRELFPLYYRNANKPATHSEQLKRLILNTHLELDYEAGEYIASYTCRKTDAPLSADRFHKSLRLSNPDNIESFVLICPHSYPCDSLWFTIYLVPSMKREFANINKTSIEECLHIPTTYSPFDDDYSMYTASAIYTKLKALPLSAPSTPTLHASTKL